jgi:CRP/FNR family nitrogen fixation transcriptional regulator
MLSRSSVAPVNILRMEGLSATSSLQAQVAANYRRGVEIYGEKEPADYVYQVTSGAVRTYKLLSDGRRQIGAFHLVGDVFGLENSDVHRFTAEAIVDTTLRLKAWPSATCWSPTTCAA